MSNIHDRCEAAFVGHAIASQFDASNQMALQLSSSLLTLKSFNGPDILSRYLHQIHTTQSDIGEIGKFVYQDFRKKINVDDRSPLSRDHFLFSQSSIEETVQTADKNFNGCTAGCNPAHRSFPLAFCPWIDDDDVFQYSLKEAALTHHNPLAGQVAGIVNLICRLLLKNRNWYDAVAEAFQTANLHPDVFNVSGRYGRFGHPIIETHSAYAPTVLNAVLHYVSSSGNAKEAIDKAHGTDKYYCSPIVGLLAGARWGIPSSMYSNEGDNAQLLRDIRATTNQLSSLWGSQSNKNTA